jgi:predicted alpha-1,2-mannosidase
MSEARQAGFHRTRIATLGAAVALVAGLTAAFVAAPAAHAAPAPAQPASLVNPIIGTSGEVNTFPGPDMPFGMIQWSPDTSPHRPDGGGYEYNDSKLRGFSLTHIGTGCPAYGDVPILPLVGPLPADPANATADFSHASESAQAGYYKVTTTHPAGAPGIMSQVDEMAASGENPPNEVKENLIDGSVETKWLTFADNGWMRFRFSTPVTVDDYALTSANDTPTRDPRDWALEGSADGSTWTTLDTRAGQDFSDRFSNREYAFTNTQAYQYYRLNITANHGDVDTQLSEVQLATGPIQPPSGDPNPVTTELTTTTRAGIANFTFPASTQSNLLLKVADTASHMSGTTAQVVGDDEVTGSVTAGQFCGVTSERDYTLHFDMRFQQPFTAHRTWPGGPNGGPGGVALTFDTTASQRITAKVGISFTSDANAAHNLDAEIAGWNFDAVRAANFDAWNQMLGRIEIGGGTSDEQIKFYTALYHSLLTPNVFSDENGEYTGMDGKVHTVAPGHAQYADYSGWDIYRSQVQLAALVAPHETSDSIRSMLNDYDQGGMLPKWAQANGETYVMVGDPADAIIAGAYAFGARDFDAGNALQAMVSQATQPSNIRPGQSTIDRYGYQPYDESVGCCNFNGAVSTQLEYDTADYAIAALAKSIGHHDTYTKFAARAQNWQNIYNPSTGYIQARLKNGEWQPDFSPATNIGFVEGTSSQYTPMVPFNIQALIAARGGDKAYEDYLDSLFTNIAHPGPLDANLSNEPSIEIPWEYNYVGAPWKTQQVVREAQQQLYFNAPVGQFGNDDMGAMSSWFVWSNLGLYPEVPGTDTLVIGSPVFPRAVVHLANGKKITINAPNAAAGAPYVQHLELNGDAWSKTYLNGHQYQHGAALDFDLGPVPNTVWGTGGSAAPPSDGTGEQPVLASVDPATVVVQRGMSAAVTIKAFNVTGSTVDVSWTAGGDNGLTVTPDRATIKLGAYAHESARASVGGADHVAPGTYPVTFRLSAPHGVEQTVTVHVVVAAPGEIWPYFTNAGISDDTATNAANFDGSGWSYSAQALAAAGVTPGGSVSAGSIDYTWPDRPAGTPDNIEATGQTIPLIAPAGATRIGLLGSASNTTILGAGGTATVTYTDGSTSQFAATLSDWVLGGQGWDPVAGNTTVLNLAYRNHTGNERDDLPVHVYSLDAPLTAGKTLAGITLPNATGGDMHIFSIGFG